MTYCGIDAHSKYSQVCIVSEEGETVLQRQIPSTEKAVRRFFSSEERGLVVLEAGSVSTWLARLIEETGHEVVVVNPRRLRLIAESSSKSDRSDAEILARTARLDLDMLRPVHQRSEQAQEMRTHLTIRTSLVKSRTGLINSVRAVLRGHGYRIRASGGEYFLRHFLNARLPENLTLLLDPLIEALSTVCEQLARFDEELQEAAQEDPVACRLQTIPGVGPIVSLSFIAWMDDPKRFADSRDVGPCLGLRPRMRSSGERERLGSITKEGDGEMRRLLVQAAHACLASRKESRLQRWARALERRVGKRKAVVALGRKIGVLMHCLWIREEDFRAFPA